MYNNRPNYDTPAYKSWRFNVFKDFEFTCCLCHRKGVPLQAHHIIRVAENPDLELVRTNGVCLCKDCHENKVNGHEKEYEDRFRNIVKQRLIASGGAKRGRKTKGNHQQRKYKPRNPRIRF